MSSNNNLSLSVDSEGRALEARMLRLSPTSIKVTWVPPVAPQAYNGVVVVASIFELNPSNFPTNTVRYNASTNWGVPIDKIGAANVVGAFYDDLTTKELVITGLPPDAAIYIAVHLATNVYGYFAEGVRTYAEEEGSSVFAGKIPDAYEPPDSPMVGQVYFDPNQETIFVWEGTTWLPSSTHTAVTGMIDPVPPFDGYPAGWPIIGAFFYNTKSKMLKTWTGATWLDSESKKGQPSYNTLGIGTTGEPTARASIKNILKHQLGYPVVCVELVEEHFNIAIDNALQELRRRVDSAYYRQYYFMQIIAGQDRYYLNDPTKGLDGIVDVVKIHRLNMVGLTTLGPNSIYAQQFLTQFYTPNGFDLVAVHLMHALSETYTQIFAGEIAYNWRETTRELAIYRRFFSNEKVLLECSMERPEQELLVDRWTQQWIQQWAESELMFMLGHIRGKFASLPGPGGGLSLNADMLMSEGSRLQEDCLRQVKDYEVGQFGPDNFFSSIVVG